MADGASFWVATPILLVLAAELMAVAAGPALRARTLYHRRRLERSQEQLLWVEASLWLDGRGRGGGRLGR